ncbi:MAG TPA: TlpA disulfide reductase family protein [Thermomicrobiales bacterium]|nr:TlpA disulfide reductase family protein [Thermomicrobiales bacterium]
MATLEAGATAPELDLTLEDAEGTPRSIATVLRDGPVLLGIYKSSCQASKTMFPFLERLHERYGQNGLQVLGVSQDSANITRSFARRAGITFPILIEPEGYPISTAFGITATPTVYLIRPGGEIVFDTMGFFADPVNELGRATATEVAADSVPLYTEEDTERGTPPFVPG